MSHPSGHHLLPFGLLVGSENGTNLGAALLANRFHLRVALIAKRLRLAVPFQQYAIQLLRLLRSECEFASQLGDAVGASLRLTGGGPAALTGRCAKT